MKIFNTRSKEVATSCMEMFNFPLLSVCISNRKSNFLRKLSISDIICLCVLNIRPNIELCCLIVFDFLQCFISLLFLCFVCFLLLLPLMANKVVCIILV